jgi:hypothetical protein
MAGQSSEKGANAPKIILDALSLRAYVGVVNEMVGDKGKWTNSLQH